MKKLNLLWMAFAFSLVLSAQENAADKLFDKYADKEGFTTISFSSGMVKMLADLDDEDDKDNFLKQIKEVRILTGDDGQKNLNFYREINNSFPKNDYEELMTIKDSDSNVKIWIKEKEGMISELVLVAGGADENTLIIVRGNIKPDKLAGIGSSLNVDGLSVLNNLK